MGRIQKIRKFGLFFLVGVMLTTILLPTLKPQVVHAAQQNPLDQLERWLYYRGMRACFSGTNRLDWEPSRDDIMSGHWFLDGTSVWNKSKGFGYLAPGMDDADDNDGTVACSDGSIFYRGATLFGFDNAVNFFCAMNRSMDKIGKGDRITPSDPLDCEKSTDFKTESDDSAWQQALTRTLEDEGSKDRPRFNINDNNGSGYTYKSLLYLIGKRSLEVFCGNNQPLSSAVAERTTAQIEASKKLVSVRVVESDGTISPKHAYPITTPGRDENSSVNDIMYAQGAPDNDAIDMKCVQMAEMTRLYVDDYQAWAKANPEEALKNDTAGMSDSGKDKDTCESSDGSGVLGWIGCGILRVLDSVIGFLDNQINGLLLVDSEGLSNAGLKNSWAVMRNIAYLILVPMMLLMVIGTAVGFGPFDPYTVKKALPRMVLAVIFISISYYICTFLVQISNIAGSGILNLVSLTGPGGNVSSLTDIFNGGDGTLLFTTLTVAGAVYGILGAGITWGVAGSFALITFVALLIGYIILVLRQVLIVMLILLSPLAILVWIFPGNDKLWNIWRTTLIAMLMMFPLVMLLIASGRFFAGTVKQMDLTGGVFIMLIAYIAPYFLIPTTFKYGLGIFGSLAGMVNDRSRGLFDRQKKFRENSRAGARQRAMVGKRFQGGNDTNWRGKLNRGVANTLTAPGAVLESGNLTSPGNWRTATRTALQNRQLAEVERNLQENQSYQSWKFNDGLNRAAGETNNAQELRKNLIDSGFALEGSQELEDAVNRVETTRRSMSPEAFRAMTTRQAIAGGTAYKSRAGGPKTAAGEVMAAIARAGGNDDALTESLVANARSDGMKAGRIDYGGAGFGRTLGVVNRMRDELRQSGTISQATIEQATRDIHEDVYQSQGASSLVHSSMKPSAVEELAPEMVRTVDGALSSGNSRKIIQEFASLSAVQEGLRGSNPQKAKHIANNVMSQQIDIASLSPEMKQALQPALLQSDGSYRDSGSITYQQAIDGLQANPDFKEMVKTYANEVDAQLRGQRLQEPGGEVNPRPSL